MTKRFPVWLTDEAVYRALQARAARTGRSVGEEAAAALAAWCAVDVPNAAAVERQVTRPPKMRAKPETPASSTTEATTPAEQPQARIEPPSDACRKCGHQRSMHWTRGCQMGCPCTEERYVPEPLIPVRVTGRRVTRTRA